MRFCSRLGFATAALALGVIPASATELAILRNGSAIRHEHRKALESVIRLYLTETTDSFVDVPSEEIVGYEKIETPAKPELPPEPRPAHALTLGEVISSASSRNQLDPDLVASLIRVESGFNTKAVSPKGAKGLMQLMPQTAEALGVGNPFDPTSNVEAGTRYLRDLLDAFHGDLIKALAAYNAGPDSVALYGGVPPYSETRSYVARILSDLRRTKMAKQNLNRRDANSRSGTLPR